jgi:hypothetical protein
MVVFSNSNLKVKGARLLTLSFAPLSAKKRAIIFMLRPHMAAKTIGNTVGPYSWLKS